MMDSFSKRAIKQSNLLLQAMKTEKDLLAEEKVLENVLQTIKQLAAQMNKDQATSDEEAKLFKSYQDKLAQLKEELKRKETQLENAKKKFDESWKALVGFHQQKTSLA